MSISRRVKRALSKESRLSGFKQGEQLRRIFPTEGSESFPTKARRFAKMVWQERNLRAAGVVATPPAGMI